MATGWVSDGENGAVVQIRVNTKASRNEVLAPRADRLVVAVTTPPVDGRANAAVRKLLAKKLGTAPSNVEILRGETSRDKSLTISGMTAQRVIAAIDGGGR